MDSVHFKLSMNTAYVYKWVHLPTLRWYVGSRTAKNSHLNDGYICSSKTVKPLIIENPQEWQRFILGIGLPQEMRELESEILISVNAKDDARSFNKHNQDLKFVCDGHSEETIKKIIKNHAFLGKKRPNHSAKLTGKKRKLEDIKKWADAMRGIPKSDEHKKNLKKAKSKGIYLTPCGEFESSRDAAEANGCTKNSVLNRCFGYRSSRGVWYDPVDLWYFIPKETK